MTLRQSPLDVARGVSAFHSRPNRDQFLSAFPRPVIVVTGADDSAPGLKVSTVQANSARHGRLHVVPECGHYVPLERTRILKFDPARGDCLAAMTGENRVFGHCRRLDLTLEQKVNYVLPSF